MDRKQKRDWSKSKYDCLVRISKKNRDLLKDNQIGRAKTIAGRLDLIINSFMKKYE